MKEYPAVTAVPVLDLRDHVFETYRQNLGRIVYPQRRWTSNDHVPSRFEKRATAVLLHVRAGQ